MGDDDAYEQARKKRAESARWALAFAIWVAGAAVLWVAWEWQKTIRGTLGDLIAYVLYVALFFYFLALGPIRNWVCRVLGDY